MLRSEQTWHDPEIRAFQRVLSVVILMLLRIAIVDNARFVFSQESRGGWRPQQRR